MRRHQVFICGQRHVTLPLRFSCRNKVIWVGIFSQIGIALILTYGLGHVTALNFTPLRWVLMLAYFSCPPYINRHGLTILPQTDKWEQDAHAAQFKDKYLTIFIVKNRVHNFLTKKGILFIVSAKKSTTFSTRFTTEDPESYLCTTNILIFFPGSPIFWWD